MENAEKRLLVNAELRAADTVAEQPEDKQDDTKQQPQGKHLTGYAVVFNEPSKDLGGFKEVIDPHAFDDTDLSDVYMVANHDLSKVLASTKAGTLTLAVDDKGLHFDAQLADTTDAQDTFTNVAAGNISAMSFSFVAAKDGDTFTRDDSGQVTRTINKVASLFDVSTVAIPAYDSTNVAVDKRGYDQFIDKVSERAPQSALSAQAINLQQNETAYNKENTKMVQKNLINPATTEARDYENYIRSHGEQRDGLTTSTAGVVLPKEVVTPIFEAKTDKNDLSQYVTMKTVSAPSGAYPVSLRNDGVLATKEELAEIADADVVLKGVDYKLATRAGKIYLSDEIASDTAINVVDEVKGQLQQLVANTRAHNILGLLADGKSFQTANAASIDDLKAIKNKQLAPELTPMVITNQDGFNYLDTQKDSDGRYLLQPDLTAPAGKSLFGFPIVVKSNKLLASPAGGVPIIMGDLAEAIFIAFNKSVTTNWEQFDSYSQGLAVILRDDYEVIDENAAVYVTLKPAGTSTTTTTASK